jgi:hypothetical protein
LEPDTAHRGFEQGAARLEGESIQEILTGVYEWFDFA